MGAVPALCENTPWMSPLGPIFTDVVHTQGGRLARQACAGHLFLTIPHPYLFLPPPHPSTSDHYRWWGV